MKMKKLIFIILILVSAGVTFAQEVISAAGETKSNSGYEVSWTVGEPAIQTLSSESNTLTQGFHQTELIITALDEITDLKNLISVFPNPTHRFAVVKYKNIPKQNTYRLFNLSGKLLESKEINSTETQVDLARFAEGTYLLKIVQDNGNPLQTFKIIKR